MNENKININWYSGQVSDTNIPNEKKGVFSISEVGNQPIKVRHVSDQSIARCNKNMIADLQNNRRERQESLDTANQPRFGKTRILKK